jgi:carbon monoxide dehydrogenase subunit G
VKLTGTIVVPASIEEVYHLFQDPLQLAKVVPGCEEAHQVDTTHYEARLAVKLPFMTIHTRARGRLLEAEEPRHLAAEMVGEPIALAGAFRSRLAVDLAPVEGGTSVTYVIDITLLGRLASLGEALVRATSQRLAAQFVENVTRLFSIPVEETSERSTS